MSPVDPSYPLCECGHSVASHTPACVCGHCARYEAPKQQLISLDSAFGPSLCPDCGQEHGTNAPGCAECRQEAEAQREATDPANARYDELAESVCDVIDAMYADSYVALDAEQAKRNRERLHDSIARMHELAEYDRRRPAQMGKEARP